MNLGIYNERLSQWFRLITFDELGRKVPCWSGAPTGQNGAYIIYHELTTKFYLGSTKNLSSRMSKHRGELERNEHYNYILQKLYFLDPRFIFAFIPTSTREEAYDIEQWLLNRNFNLGTCVNFSINARIHGTGHQMTEENKALISLAQQKESWRENVLRVMQSPEHRQRVTAQFSKPVIIEGIEYPSAANAARILGMAERTVHGRIQSSNPLFINWQKK